MTNPLKAGRQDVPSEMKNMYNRHRGNYFNRGFVFLLNLLLFWFFDPRATKFIVSHNEVVQHVSLALFSRVIVIITLVRMHHEETKIEAEC